MPLPKKSRAPIPADFKTGRRQGDGRQHPDISEAWIVAIVFLFFIFLSRQKPPTWCSFMQRRTVLQRQTSFKKPKVDRLIRSFVDNLQISACIQPYYVKSCLGWSFFPHSEGKTISLISWPFSHVLQEVGDGKDITFSRLRRTKSI